MRYTIRGPYTAADIVRRPLLKKKLLQLTNGGFGRGPSTLYPLLSHLTEKNRDLFWLAWCNGEVVGWVWQEKVRKRNFYLQEGLRERKVSTIGTFVHHRHRKQGIGTRLVHRLNQHTPRDILFIEEAWNQAGYKLYEKINERTSWRKS